LLGKTDCDIVRLALVRGVLGDARSAWFGAVYGGNFKDQIEGVLKEKIHPKLDQLNKYAGSTKTGLAAT